MLYNKLNKADFFSLMLPVILGILSVTIWILEIRYFIGWDGIEWILFDMKSVYLVALFSVLSFVLPPVIIGYSNSKRALIAALILYVFSIFAFFLSKQIFRQLYLKIGEKDHVIYVWLLIFLVTITAAIFYLTKDIFLFKSEKFHIMTIVAVFISIVPASMITIEWFRGFAVTESFVEAVKMGYPIFWLNILLGWVSYVMAKRFI